MHHVEFCVSQQLSCSSQLTTWVHLIRTRFRAVFQLLQKNTARVGNRPFVCVSICLPRLVFGPGNNGMGFQCQRKQVERMVCVGGDSRDETGCCLLAWLRRRLTLIVADSIVHSVQVCCWCVSLCGWPMARGEEKRRRKNTRRGRHTNWAAACVNVCLLERMRGKSSSLGLLCAVHKGVQRDREREREREIQVKLRWMFLRTHG